MLLFYVIYSMKEGKRREDFYRALEEERILELTMKEKGNRMYDFSYSAGHQGKMCLVEAWDSEEALMEHKKTDQFFRLQDIKAEYVEDMVLKRYEVTA